MQCPFYVIPLVLGHVTFPMGPSDWIFTPWWIYSTTSMDWLMLAQLELKAIRHRNVVLARMKELGVKTKRQEKCAFSITEDHLSRRGLGFDHDGMRHDCLLLVSSRSSRQSRG